MHLLQSVAILCAICAITYGSNLPQKNEISAENLVRTKKDASEYARYGGYSNNGYPSSYNYNSGYYNNYPSGYNSYSSYPYTGYNSYGYSNYPSYSAYSGSGYPSYYSGNSASGYNNGYRYNYPYSGYGYSTSGYNYPYNSYSQNYQNTGGKYYPYPGYSSAQYPYSG